MYIFESFYDLISMFNTIMYTDRGLCSGTTFRGYCEAVIKDIKK